MLFIAALDQLMYFDVLATNVIAEAANRTYNFPRKIPNAVIVMESPAVRVAESIRTARATLDNEDIALRVIKSNL